MVIKAAFCNFSLKFLMLKYLHNIVNKHNCKGSVHIITIVENFAEFS